MKASPIIVNITPYSVHIPLPDQKHGHTWNDQLGPVPLWSGTLGQPPPSPP